MANKHSETARKMRSALRRIYFVRLWNRHTFNKKMDAVHYGERTGDYNQFWAMMPKINLK